MNLFHANHTFWFDIVETLGHSSWLGIVIVIIASIGNHLLRANSPNGRYWLNLTALVVFGLSMPVAYWWCSSEASEGPVVEMTVSESLSAPDTGGAEFVAQAGFEIEKVADQVADSHSTATAHSSRAQVPSLPSWIVRLIVASYLAGVCYMFLRLALAVRRSQKLFQSSVPVTDSELLEKVDQVSRAFSLRAQPVIAMSEKIAVPVAVGLIRPAVLLPASIISGLSVREIEFVLRHEMAHLYRYDQLVVVLQRLIESLLFYHPAVWYLSRRIHEERENCCDDLACIENVDRMDYANVLVRVAELSLVSHSSESGNSVALAADGHRPSKLRQRISRLLNPATAKPVTGPGIMLCIAIILSTSAALLAGHALAGQLDDNAIIGETEKPDDDAKRELFDLLRISRKSYASIRTGHVKFKHVRKPLKLDITRDLCMSVIEKMGPIDSEDKFNEMIRALAKLEPSKKPISFVDAELHFDQVRTRESINQSGELADIHITTKEHSMRWSPANYQLNVAPLKDNNCFQLTAGHFLRPLLPAEDSPFFEASMKELRSCVVTRSGDNLMVEHQDDGVRLLVSGKSGFPIYQASDRPTGSIKYRGGWNLYRNNIWFPNVSFELRFKDGNLAYVAAQIVESARFNMKLPEHLFVMSAPAGTNLIHGGKYNGRISEDVFDVLSAEEIELATRNRKQRELTDEEKRGAKAAKKLFLLQDGEVFKRLGPPFPLAQTYVVQMQGQVPDGRRPQGTTSWIFKHEEGDNLECNYFAAGSEFKVRQLAERVLNLHPAAIEGDEDLLNKRLPGDFVFRSGADRTEVTKAIQHVLQSEFQCAIEVKFEDVIRPKYVASGDFKLDLGSRSEVAVHSGSKPNQFPTLIQSGNIEEFLKSLSKYINQTVTMGNVSNAQQQFTWSEAFYGNDRKPKGKRFKFDVEKVLKIVESQTGLKFEKQESVKTVLVIRKVAT